MKTKDEKNVDNNENNVNNEIENKEVEETVETIDTVEKVPEENTTEVKEEVVKENEEKKEEVQQEPAPEPQGEPQKVRVGLIVTIVIIVVAIIVLIILGLFVWAGSTITSLFKSTDNETNSTIVGVNEISNISSTTDNVLEDDYSNTLIENTTTEETTTSSSTARTSTLEDPLQVGEWGIASKYNTSTSSNQDVNVSVTNIIRGEEARQIAMEYMNSDSSIYVYEEPDAYQEWVVIEYDVDFADTYIPGSIGASPTVEADVTGADGSSVKYNGITYINQVIEIGSRDYIQGPTGSGKLLTQLPVGYTDYIIQFGRYNGTTAYFQGQ